MSLKETFKKAIENAKIKQQNDIIKIAEFKKQGIIYCPKCLSTNIYVGKKGFGIGKAIAGGILAGTIGLAGGLIGSNKVIKTCLNCGNKFR